MSGRRLDGDVISEELFMTSRLLASHLGEELQRVLS
jgi:hypothetical protein